MVTKVEQVITLKLKRWFSCWQPNNKGFLKLSPLPDGALKSGVAAMIKKNKSSNNRQNCNISKSNVILTMLNDFSKGQNCTNKKKAWTTGTTSDIRRIHIYRC